MDTKHIDLYPEIDPYENGFLYIDDFYTLYWEQCGNPKGIPVLFLHGGPGAGASPVHRRFFDPSVYRTVIFDQRGCGRSFPVANVSENTTAHLVRDIEMLREHLGIKEWLVFGGSWGSTLALAYGIDHGARCLGFILRGVFLGTKDEIDWFLFGMRKFFPEAWNDFYTFLPKHERDTLLQSYYKRLTDPDPVVHGPAAKSWTAYEARCSNLIPRPISAANSQSVQMKALLGLARIEAHYFLNNMFFDEGYIESNIKKYSEAPCIIVQGRYDVICPISTASRLKTMWSDAQLKVVPDAGHSALEPGIRSALVSAMETMKSLISYSVK